MTNLTDLRSIIAKANFSEAKEDEILDRLMQLPPEDRGFYAEARVKAALRKAGVDPANLMRFFPSWSSCRYDLAKLFYRVKCRWIAIRLDPTIHKSLYDFEW